MGNSSVLNLQKLHTICGFSLTELKQNLGIVFYSI